MKAFLALTGLLLTVACGPTVAPSPALPIVNAPFPITKDAGPARIAGTPIEPGQSVAGIVEGTDPTCFYNWDATGHCRQYDLTAPGDGTVIASLRWPPPSRGLYDPDVFLVARDGVWEYAPEAWPEKQVSLKTTPGAALRIVVLAYGLESQPFDLTVQFEPGS